MDKANKKKRPRGVLIISIITAISGVMLLLMSGYAFSMLLPGGGAALMGPSLLLILGGTSLLAAYGLYMVKSWSWTLTLVLSGFGAAGYLFNIVSGRIISIARII